MCSAGLPSDLLVVAYSLEVYCFSSIFSFLHIQFFWVSWFVGVCMQLEDPAIRWQMALYKDMPNRSEDTADPEKTVERVLDIAHVLFHLDQVSLEKD